MTGRWLSGLLVLTALAALGFGFYLTAPPFGSEQQPPGRALYVANCASCHGANLEGQPDWMRRLPSGRLPAPPHDESGHTWHHSDRQLFTIVKLGLQVISPGYESDMPAFQGVLTDAEVREVLAYIKSTWSNRAKAYQADRSKSDP